VTELDLRALADALHQHQVRYVVIGGLAVAAHGYVRATKALDIVPDPDRDNLRRLANALIDLEAVVPPDDGQSFDHQRHGVSLRRGRNVTLTTRFGGLDVVQRAPGVPSYEDLAGKAVETQLLGVPVRICSLADLRQMKAARASERDLADLKGLADA
jgi:hypothetical protein